MAEAENRKLIRSYRIVFRRRWRIFRIQGWRIPLPGGLELRALGYWLACLVAIALLGRVSLLGIAVGALPASLRLLALPLAGAWALSRWEVDGRSPHRALLGELGWRLRARELAGLRRCPAEGTLLAPPEPIVIAADLRGARYPRGRLDGPVRVLLRYPVRVEVGRAAGRASPASAKRLRSARRWRLSGAGRVPLQRGRTLEIPAGRAVIFEASPR